MAGFYLSWIGSAGAWHCCNIKRFVQPTELVFFEERTAILVVLYKKISVDLGICIDSFFDGIVYARTALLGVFEAFLVKTNAPTGIAAACLTIGANALEIV